MALEIYSTIILVILQHVVNWKFTWLLKLLIIKNCCFIIILN